MFGLRMLVLFLAVRECNADRVTKSVRALQPIQDKQATLQIHALPALASQDLSTDKVAKLEEKPSGDSKDDVDHVDKPWHSRDTTVVATTEETTTEETTTEETTTEEPTTTEETTTTAKPTVKETWHHLPTDPRLQGAREQLQAIHRLEVPQQQPTGSADESEVKNEASNGQKPLVYKLAGVVDDALKAHGHTKEVNTTSGNNTYGEGKVVVYVLHVLEEQSSHYLEQLPDWLEWMLYIFGVGVGCLAIYVLHMAKYRAVHGCATVFCLVYCCPCGFLSLCFPLDEATPEMPPRMAQHDDSGRTDPRPAPAEGESDR